MPEIELTVSPAFAIRRLTVGWTVPEALCAVIDNAVDAGASNVWVHVRRFRADLTDKSRNNVAAYEVVDEGRGMDAAGLLNALTLGSSSDDYDPHSLSKFGLGLKAAAFSQGDRLELISSRGGGSAFEKRVVSIAEVEASGRYFARTEPLTDADRALISAHLPAGQGTVVRIADVRRENHPRESETLKTLRERLGIIYYYFMINRGLRLHVEDAAVAPYDVLRTAEADANGDLDEHAWDGETVRWLHHEEEIPLDVENGITARIEATQLPHPPTFKLKEGAGGDKRIRDDYKIGEANYGYYVYRNDRLISWAERFDGIIPRATDQDLYSFRGRIQIDETADDAFNIDVKKSHLMLSEDAEQALNDLSSRLRAKSRAAWRNAKKRVTDLTNQKPNETANEIVEDFTPPELPEDSQPTADEIAERQRRADALAAEYEARMREEARRQKSERENRAVTDAEVTPGDVTAAATGGANPSAARIRRVDRVQDNALWEPYHDAAAGDSVRINRHHRFARVIFENNEANTDLQVLSELFLLQLASAEVYTRTHLSGVDAKAVARVVDAFRRTASEFLAAMCRDLEDELPPL